MIEIKDLTKIYKLENTEVAALKNINLTINDGDIFGIIGMSGAGKSTLVRTINMLERPTSGSIIIDGVDMGSLTEQELRKKRREITMIFQGFNLLMQRNCLKNVCFPLELAGVGRQQAEQKAMGLLELVGLGEKAYAYPAQLSGGQQQRVAIARALATEPKVLLCDEATSALDPNTTNQILGLIRDINSEYGITTIIITHQMSVVESVCKSVAIIDDGNIVEQGAVAEVFSNPKSKAARRLVFPEGEEDALISAGSDELFLRLVFNGTNATGKPVIATLAAEKGIYANICYASSRDIGNTTYGSVLLGISGGRKNLEIAMDYINSLGGVTAKEVKRYAE